ncbi:hypothetical protein GCM10011323_16110 [Pontibacter amylolyticus]|uniref:O-antigen ligase domain-containing protein n=1 Tax=Pontibacter amylolyticus TaxID=1424080 RepID=A0ABQ1W310_9BACT|nr:hypothetical protein GCM10011323_16110 [Pontibacter amylolyticus]
MSFGIDVYFDNRFSEGLLELLEPPKDITPSYLYSISSSDISTTEFRRLHFLERFYYALESTDKSLFGFGFLTEDSWLVHELSFNIGVASEYGEIAQVSTSDISWSIFVVHFGIIGTLAVFLFYLGFATKFYLMRKYEYCKVGFLYIIALVLTSFYGIDIILPHTISLLVFIVSYWYSCKYSEESKDICVYQEAN